MDPRRVSVVACYYNQAHLAPIFWEGIRQNLGDVAEVVIVKDGSWGNDEWDKVTRGSPEGLTIIFGSHPKRPHGVAESFNIGIRLARSPLVYLLGSDMAPLPGAIAAHREKLKQGTVTIGPLSDYTDLVGAWTGPYLNSGYLTQKYSKWASSRPWLFFRNGNVLHFREDLLKVGLFDVRCGETGYDGVEDKEFAVRWSMKFGVDSFIYVESARGVHNRRPYHWVDDSYRGLTKLPEVPKTYLDSLGRFFNRRYSLFTEKSNLILTPTASPFHKSACVYSKPVLERRVDASVGGIASGDAIAPCHNPEWLEDGSAIEIFSYVTDRVEEHIGNVLPKLSSGGRLHLMLSKIPQFGGELESGHCVIEKPEEAE